MYSKQHDITTNHHDFISPNKPESCSIEIKRQCKCLRNRRQKEGRHTGDKILPIKMEILESEQTGTLIIIYSILPFFRTPPPSQAIHNAKQKCKSLSFAYLSLIRQSIVSMNPPLLTHAPFKTDGVPHPNPASMHTWTHTPAPLQHQSHSSTSRLSGFFFSLFLSWIFYLFFFFGPLHAPF